MATHGSLLSYVSLHRYPCPRDRPRPQRAQRAAERPTGCNHFAQQREEIAKQRRALLSAFGFVAVRGGLDRFDRRPDLPTSGPDTRQNTGKAGFGRRILATWRCPADDLERHRTERPLPQSVRLPTLRSTLLPKSHSARSGLEYLCSQRPARISGEHGWRTQMKHMTRACSVLVVTAFGWVAAAAPALAQNAPQCVVSGSPPAGWGFNSIGYIQIASGSSCRFSVNITGEILSSAVSQNPAHGTLQQLDAASFVYTSQAGYNGSDTFAVQATGKSPTSSGVSVITINASLQ